VFGALAGLPALAGVAVAKPATDAAFAAIERHKAALTHFDVICPRNDEVESRTVSDADEAKYQAVNEDETREFFALLSRCRPFLRRSCARPSSSARRELALTHFRVLGL
jgi:hypothetical protein